MKIKVIASTNQNLATKEELDLFSGKAAGICYMPGKFEDLVSEDVEKTKKRVNMTMNSGHHSVFEHVYFSIELSDVPKIFAMLLNNEKVFATSEKSARYTRMNPSVKEKLLYEKWIEILQDEIKKNYSNNNYFTDSKIKKLAQENARYFISVFSPTTLLYSVSYRQLNYIYNWLKDLENSQFELYRLISPYAKEFCEQIEQSGYIDSQLKDGKARFFSLIATRTREEHFGESYSVNYQSSFASFAQAQRHRTLNYELSIPKQREFYIPKIIKRNDSLQHLWLEDMDKVKDLYPQGQLLNVNERGTIENFILKCKERLCTCAQLETAEITKNTLLRYINEAQSSQIREELLPYNRGARCTFPDYSCPAPCHFDEGVTLERMI